MKFLASVQEKGDFLGQTMTPKNGSDLELFRPRKYLGGLSKEKKIRIQFCEKH